MTSELDIWLAGVIFRRDPETGSIRPEGPPGIDLRSAVAERMDAVRSRLSGGSSLDGGRRGQCDSCGCAMAISCDGAKCFHIKKRGAASVYEGCTIVADDGTRLYRPAAERWKRHGSSSNRGGTCWLCECAITKLVKAGEWPPKVNTSRNERIATVLEKVRAPWE